MSASVVECTDSTGRDIMITVCDVTVCDVTWIHYKPKMASKMDLGVDSISRCKINKKILFPFFLLLLLLLYFFSCFVYVAVDIMLVALALVPIFS